MDAAIHLLRKLRIAWEDNAHFYEYEEMNQDKVEVIRECISDLERIREDLIERNS